jgi:23S rRNA (adenine-N6)-dimethyltransferase
MPARRTPARPSARRASANLPGNTTGNLPGTTTGNPSGIHFLHSRRVADGLARSAGAGPGDLVVELGAGQGALTAALAATGARVLAVERDPAFARRLARRFAGRPQVRVVTADLRTVPLPRRPYLVVANLPFSVTTATLRRLLGRPGDPPLPGFAGADLLVEWGLARRLTEPVPATLETAWWAACHELTLVRRVPASCFAPVPRVDAAHMAIRPVRQGPAARRALRELLTAAYAAPGRPASALLGTLVPKRRAHRLLTSTGIDPPAPAGTVAARSWAGLASALLDG